MQKISSYLYPNRIELCFDLTADTKEYRTVYQRRFKIYKGFKNDLLLDIKNSDQKRINVSDKTVKFTVLDQNNQELYTATATHSNTPGLATVTIPATALSQIRPQFLKYSVYIQNNDMTRSPIYGDTQFGLEGTIELLEQGLYVPTPELFIDTFKYLIDDSVMPFIKRYTSEAALVNPLNDLQTNPSIGVDFYFLNFEGTVTVQLTTDSVIQTETLWKTVETFNVSSTTSTLTKSYTDPLYTKESVWLRVQYILSPNTTGTIDKIRIRR